MGYYCVGGRSRYYSIFDTFSLYPLPYHVLLILTVVVLLLRISWFLSYESMTEANEKQMSWVLLATPVLLLLTIRWLSSAENPGVPFGLSPYELRRWKRSGYFHNPAEEGSSPWGVAAVVVLLLVLLSFQSAFRDMWLL